MLVSVISAELNIVPNFNSSDRHKCNMSTIEITTNDSQILIHKMARMMLEIHISKTQEMLLTTTTERQGRVIDKDSGERYSSPLS